MSKLSKKQQEIELLAKQLKPISKTDKLLMESKTLYHHAVIRNNKYYCVDCNKTTDKKISKNRKTIICPHCHKKLEILKKDEEYQTFSRNEFYKTNGYLTIIQSINKYQVFRTYHIIKTQKIHQQKNQNKPAVITYNEIFQHWVSSDFKIETYRKPKTLFGGAWNVYCNYMIFRKENNKYNYYNYVTTDAYAYHKIKSLQPWLKKRGFINPDKLNISAKNEIEILKEPFLETLIKEKRLLQLQAILYYRKETFKNYINQLKIINRHNYNLPNKQEYSIWFDTIDLIRKCNGDDHNPKFICPANLNAEHDKWLNKHEKNKIYEEMLKREEENKQYEKRIEKIKNLIIEEKNIIIKPLLNIKEFYIEGKSMHHCVYRNEYYNKKDSIILSARDTHTNTRIATIEYNVNLKKIIQCYAAFNKIPEQKTDIEKLIMKNRKKLIIAA